jgi:epoxyqueuosine reductase
VSIANAHGITHVGVCSADVLTRARAELLRRKAEGLHDGMQFTYRNPQRSTDPCRAVPEAAAVLVGAAPYYADLDGDLEGDSSSGPHQTDQPRGRVARYAWRDHYAPLRDGLRAIARQLRRDGHRAVAFADDNSMVDREVAQRAGIGWFGKNANILLPGAGSWFVLGNVVTTAPLPVDALTVADGCGTCHRCLDACPTAAIVAPGVVDARRCLAWILQKPGVIDPQWREAIGDRLYGCDDCQTVCPPNVRFAAGHRAAAGPVEPCVSLFEILDADDGEVMRRWGRWYVADRDPRWVRRNALVALGNVGDRGDPGVRARLGRYLQSPDSILRAHAVWAAQQLGLDELLPDDDTDPIVARELVRVL